MSYQNEINKVNRSLLLLAPRLQVMVMDALSECKAQGYEVDVFEAWRSPKRQQNLYEQGRTAAGPKVTNAFAWYSFHNYGLAVDIVFKVGGKWSWDESLPWEKVATIFESHGFDKPPVFEKAHFQVSKGMHITEAYRITKEHGVQGLWIALDLD